MERIHLIPSLVLDDAPERTLLDLVAAIRLVGAGGARRIVLTSLPAVEQVAAQALVHAQQAGVEFRLARPGAGAPSHATPTAFVGPRSRSARLAPAGAGSAESTDSGDLAVLPAAHPSPETPTAS